MTSNVDAWLNIWRRTPANATQTVIAEADARGQHDECLTALLIQIREAIETARAARAAPPDPERNDT